MQEAPFPLDLKVENFATSALIPDPRNARKHGKRQIARLKDAIGAFGFTAPLVIDEDMKVLAGHARLQAAIGLGMTTVPCLRLKHLSTAQKTAFALADNKIGDMSEFDAELLSQQLSKLCAVDFEVTLTGFETAEIDLLLQQFHVSTTDPADDLAQPAPTASPVSRRGDLWQLGRHRLLCGNALDTEVYKNLLGERRAQMVFADAASNVPIQGHVSGLGRTRHREFAMGSGEMSSAELTKFLSDVMANLVRHSTDGSLHFHCMDWRHITESMAAGTANYTQLTALCVWNKCNAGMGSLYRSMHELIFVYKLANVPQVNNLELGHHGRDRADVWSYPGANTFRTGRADDLKAHPTVMPAALVADAILDCTRRGDLVLDPFAGSGVTLIAAEKTGRCAAAIEIDGGYVDTAVRRWQQFTGAAATLAGDGRSFEELAASRDTQEAGHD